MGLRAGLDRCGKTRPTGIRSPDRPARSSVAIPTELPGSRTRTVNETITRFQLCVILHNFFQGTEENHEKLARTQGTNAGH